MVLFPERSVCGLTANGAGATSARPENNHAAALAALTEVGECQRCVVDSIGARNQFVELQTAASVQADQARKILLRPRRSIIAAGQCLLAERDLLCVQGDLILWA